MRQILRCSKSSRGKAIQPLCKVLKELGYSPNFEVSLPWLRLPSPDQYHNTPGLEDIAIALIDHATTTVAQFQESTKGPPKGRNRKIGCNPEVMLLEMNAALAIDIYIPSLDIAIEFDEQQHFSEERGVSLGAYKIDVPFDLDRWVSLCSQRTYDIDPPARDWHRAFRDSVRDYMCAQQGLKLLRLHYEDYSASVIESEIFSRLIEGVLK